MKKKQLNVLLLGSGGREHALAWKTSQSPRLGRLYAAPGNAGTALLGENLPFGDADIVAISDFVLANDIDMLVVGPEGPLVAGIHDHFLATPLLAHIPVIGPVAKAAMLEGSKEFAKEFMKRNYIPTAAFRSFKKGQSTEAAAFLATLNPPYVIKADGLAAGKGVVICSELEEAVAEVKAMLEDSKFGAAGETVVIEEFLSGIELSVFILTDGNDYILLPEAKDYKRIGEGDTGLNTGGMGSVSPVPFADAEFMHKVEQRVIKPTMSGLREAGISYKGFIFFGLINVDGDPYVIEYNARLGDPETESVLPRLKNDLLVLFEAVASGTLGRHKPETAKETAVCIMAVAPGYPGNYPKGMEISGLGGHKDDLVFHAGTKNIGKSVVTNGGRVLGITALGGDLEEALKKAYSLAADIRFDGMYYRKDLGLDLIKFLKEWKS